MFCIQQILFKNNVATSVVISPENNLTSTQIIHTKHEIILSAGTFQSPQILKLSGIGPKQELTRHRINIVHHSPKVGSNLYDHLNLPLFVTVNETMSVTKEKILSFQQIAKYLFYGTGVFSNFGVIGFLNDDENEHGIGIFGVGTIDENLLRRIVNYRIEVSNE